MVGRQVEPIFSISLNKADLLLLNKIQSFFKGVGNIWIDRANNAYVYSVSSVKDLTSVIIPHLNKFPLLSQKRADF